MNEEHVHEAHMLKVCTSAAACWLFLRVKVTTGVPTPPRGGGGCAGGRRRRQASSGGDTHRGAGGAGGAGRQFPRLCCSLRFRRCLYLHQA